MKYETVIGLEVHLHLKTRSKAFCGCSTEFGAAPNTQTCPVCLGFPGSLPVLNQLALDYAIKVGLALNCRVQEFTKFDRKNYFYPDLPKNYQISQYDLPISIGGYLEVDLKDGTKRIGIRRVHLEEDAGKLIHEEKNSLVDFNRAGIPLLEIVSEPEIYSPEEAYEYLGALKSILEYLEVSDCDMEKGSLRCDANISLRPAGAKELGVKTELKNMNSFKAVKDALAFEVQRQTGLLESGEKILQDTRLWDEKTSVTQSMRSKEEAKDYRYFPEPDLTTFIISKEKIAAIKKELPELPREKTARLVRDFAISQSDARILVAQKHDAQYAQDCLKELAVADKKPVVNWLVGPMAFEANNRKCRLIDLKVPAVELIKLIGYVQRSEVSHLTAKAVLTEMIDTAKSCTQIIQEKNLIQISDTASLEKYAEEAIKENPDSSRAYRSGKENAVMFLVGQVMKRSGGKANPKLVQEILKRRLKNA